MISTIFFDMDGVLCDFAGGSAHVHGKPLCRQTATWNFFEAWGMTPQEFWAPLAKRYFWASQEPLDDGMKLLRLCEEHYEPSCITILSSGLCPESVDGKRDWLRKHLPAYAKKAHFAGEEKFHSSAPCKMLIDDHDKNIEAWTAKRYRGHGVLIPRSWNSRKGEINGRGEFDAMAVFEEIQQRVHVATVTRDWMRKKEGA